MIALYAALAVTDAILLALLIALGGRWAPRAALIVAGLAVNVVLLWSVPDTSGWPTSAAPPVEAELAGCVVAEPEYVYLWLLLDDVPRSFRLPYSVDLHRTCSSAREAQRRGIPVGLRRAGQARPREGQAPGRFALYVLPPRGEVKELP